jgi:hypothetical protein
MDQALSGAAGEVVGRFQRHLRLLEPGSEAAEATEHAITLALSPDRPSKDPDLLFGDALRDARRSVARSRHRRLRVVSEAGRIAAQGIPTGATAGFVDHDSPERRLLARELVGLLRVRAAELGGAAPRVLAGLLTEESELETAAAANVSRSTVTRIRRSLRACAREHGYLPAAA